MSKKYVSQEETSVGCEHSDYSRNYQFADQFVKNCTPKLPPGMKVYIADSEHLKKSIVMICFLTESDAPKGNFACPVNLHQSHNIFCLELKKTFNQFWNMAKKNVLKAKILEKNPDPVPQYAEQNLINF